MRYPQSMQQNQRPSKLGNPHSSSPQLALVAFFCVLMVTFWGAIGWSIQREHSDAESAARRELSNLSWMFAETVKASIEAIDISAQDLRDDWLHQPDKFAERVDLKQRRLGKEVFFHVGIIGVDGHLKFSSLEPNAAPVDFNDRDHFQVHRRSQTDRLFISKPVLGRVSKRWTLQFTRPIFDGTGQFAGVIALSVAADYFTQFIKTIHFQPDSVWSLLGRDGRVLAQWPETTSSAPPLLGTEAFIASEPAGNQGWVETSSADQPVRLHIWRKLEPLDLLVTLGTSRDSIFSTQRVQRNAYLTAGAVASSILIWLGLLFVRALRLNERIRLELQTSEERWNLALESGEYTVWDFNPVTRQVFRLSRSSEIFGNPASDAEPNFDEWASRVHPQDLSRTLELMQACLRGTQERFVAEYRVRAIDGSWRWVIDRGMVIGRDNMGLALRMIGTMSDVTERRAEQQQLIDNQRFVHTLMDGLPSLVSYWRTNMTCRFTNLAYQNYFQRSAQALQDLPLSDLLSEMIFQKQRHYLEAALAGHAQMFELEWPQSDGSMRVFWAQYLPDVASDGQVQGVVSLLTDVTSVKATQTRLDLLSHQLLERGALPDTVDQAKAALLGRASEPDATTGNSSMGANELDVLLVEDYKLNQDYAEGLLALMGHRVTLANNGREALDWARKKFFDLILMDVQMPLMDGLEATRQIRTHELATGQAKTRIIAMTAYALQGESERCFAAGMDDFVTKPFTPEELAQHLNGVTTRPQ